MDDSGVPLIVDPGPSCVAELELWQLSLDDAMRRRWAEGRARYGSEWKGRHPLIEVHEELVDALVYLGVAQAPYSLRLAVQAITDRIARCIRDLRPEQPERWAGVDVGDFHA